MGLGRLELPTSPLSGVRSNHLSYRPDAQGCVFTKRTQFRLVGLGRLELPTSPLSGVRSSHLSYRPGLKTGGAGRDRTGDLLNANQALSQLSYSPSVASMKDGDSWETAGDKSEEGGVEVKSSCPLCPGLHTCYNGRYKGMRDREVEPIS